MWKTYDRLERNLPCRSASSGRLDGKPRTNKSLVSSDKLTPKTLLWALQKKKMHTPMELTAQMESRGVMMDVKRAPRDRKQEGDDLSIESKPTSLTPNSDTTTGNNYLCRHIIFQSFNMSRHSWSGFQMKLPIFSHRPTAKVGAEMATCGFP